MLTKIIASVREFCEKWGLITNFSQLVRQFWYSKFFRKVCEKWQVLTTYSPFFRDLLSGNLPRTRKIVTFVIFTIAFIRKFFDE